MAFALWGALITHPSPTRLRGVRDATYALAGFIGFVALGERRAPAPEGVNREEVSMRRWLTALVVLVPCMPFLVPVSAAAQDQAPADNPLEQIGWLVGGTWIAETRTPDGTQATIEATYRWAPHRKAITYSLVRKIANRAIPTPCSERA